jgi:hypothetical protein
MATLNATKYPNNIRTIDGVDNAALQDDVVLLCDTSGGDVEIDLAEIVPEHWSTTYKLYVYDISGNAATNNITISAPAGYMVNNAATLVLSQDGAGCILQILDNTNYVATLNITSGGGGAVTQIIAGTNVTISPISGLGAVTINANVGFISLTVAAMQALIGAGTVVVGAFYLITDANLTDGGLVVQGISTTEISLGGKGLFLNPDYENTGGNNVGVWNSLLAGLVAGVSICVWDGIQYQSVTGNVGTQPDGDAVNWLALAKSVANTYILECDVIKYDVSIDRLMYRADRYENEVDFVMYKGHNSLVQLQWGHYDPAFPSGAIGTYGNKVLGGGYIDNLNQGFRGRCIENNIIGGSAIEGNTNGGDIVANSMFDAAILIATINLGTILRNTISQASAIDLSTQDASGGFTLNNISGESTVTADTNAGSIDHNVLESVSTLLAANNAGTIGQGNDHGGNHLTSGILVATNQTAAGHFNGNVIKSSAAITIAQNESIVAGNFLHSAGTLTVAINQSRIERCEIGNQRSVTPVSPNTLSRLNYRVLAAFSNWEETLDLSDGAIWAANVLTIAVGLGHVGIFKLSNANKTVASIVNLPINHDSRIEVLTNGEFLSVTTTAVGLAAADDIIAAQPVGAIQMTGRNSGTDDVVMRKNGTFNAVIGRPNVYQ